MIVSVNVQDLLALHAQHTTQLVRISNESLLLIWHTQRAHIQSDLLVVSSADAPPCGVIPTGSKDDNIVFGGNLIHIDVREQVCQ